MNKSTYKAKRGPLFPFCVVSWILQSILFHLQGRNPYFRRYASWENLTLLWGVGYSDWLSELCERGFHQVIGICITCQCWSAEPDSKTTMRRTWNKKWKWRNEHRQIEEMGWECSSVCWNPSIYQICISNVWIVKKPVQLQHKKGMRKMRQETWPQDTSKCLKVKELNSGLPLILPCGSYNSWPCPTTSRFLTEQLGVTDSKHGKSEAEEWATPDSRSFM